jgi:hypothetical protein
MTTTQASGPTARITSVVCGPTTTAHPRWIPQAPQNPTTTRDAYHPSATKSSGLRRQPDLGCPSRRPQRRSHDGDPAAQRRRPVLTQGPRAARPTDHPQDRRIRAGGRDRSRRTYRARCSGFDARSVRVMECTRVATPMPQGTPTPCTLLGLNERRSKQIGRGRSSCSPLLQSIALSASVPRWVTRFVTASV